MSFYWYMNKKKPVLEMYSITTVNGLMIKTPILPPTKRELYQKSDSNHFGIREIPIIDVPVSLTCWQRIKRRIIKKFTRRKIGRFESYIFPVIKNVPENLCLQDLIQVQPMNVPLSETLYLDFVKVKPTRWQRFKLWVKKWWSTAWFTVFGI